MLLQKLFYVNFKIEMTTIKSSKERNKSLCYLYKEFQAIFKLSIQKKR